eukprot:CAMPEP_0201594486 /NCGR_PEP_ID=MMETSP0190_2-20130828/191784_1 /ASSEMBLY_ACC=CAM_ASM_000263 /TAXON_ID=37353 /ORGANISM="Rosalina sp." /LENGTH=149 /DNA_ID=CAMNT_0048054113 /DNA_START=196 /DNA_END=646 /DNA_ORIENTATION=+
MNVLQALMDAFEDATDAADTSDCCSNVPALQDMLDEETERSIMTDDAFQALISNLTMRLTGEFRALQDELDDETARSIMADDAFEALILNLTTRLDGEIMRSTDLDDEIRTNFTNEEDRSSMEDATQTMGITMLEETFADGCCIADGQI